MLVSGVCLQEMIRITDGNYFYYDNQEFVWVWNDKEMITFLFSPAIFFPITVIAILLTVILVPFH